MISTQGLETSRMLEAPHLSNDGWHDATSVTTLGAPLYETMVMPRTWRDSAENTDMF